VGEIVEAMRTSIHAGDQANTFRILCDGVNRLHWAADDGCLSEAVGTPPATLGDARWDALLAGSIRYRIGGQGGTAHYRASRHPFT